MTIKGTKTKEPLASLEIIRAENGGYVVNSTASRFTGERPAFTAAFSDIEDLMRNLRGILVPCEELKIPTASGIFSSRTSSTITNNGDDHGR